MLAARNDDVGLTALLTARGAVVDARDASGRTAFLHAAEAGASRTLDFLLARGADPFARTLRDAGAVELASGKQAGAPVASTRCLSCGSTALLSHSLDLREEFVRIVFPIQYFRCRTCEWRGTRSDRAVWMLWLALLRDSVPSVLLVVLVLAATVAAVLMSIEPAPQGQRPPTQAPESAPPPIAGPFGPSSAQPNEGPAAPPPASDVPAEDPNPREIPDVVRR